MRRAAKAGTDFLRQNSSALGFSGNGEPAHKWSARYSERSGQIEMDAISSFYVLRYGWLQILLSVVHLALSTGRFHQGSGTEFSV